jgi:hypothetical protein
MDKKEQIIRVAILSDELLGWGSGKQYFHIILDTYSWETTDTIYRFQTFFITDDEIIHGTLSIRDFDVFLVPGGGVGDGHALSKAYRQFKKTAIWRDSIVQFVKDGGGYVGICGGAALMTDLISDRDGFPKTMLERLYTKSALGVSVVHAYYKHLATPLLYLFQYTHPEKIGVASYVFSFAPGKTKDGKDLLSAGVPIDCTLERNHPIFSDCPDSIQRMRWWGGPAFVLPEPTDRSIDVLARYPQNDFSCDEKTKIFAWKYIGGITGLLNGFFKGLQYVKTHEQRLSQAFLYTYYFAGDWMQTDISIDLDFSNKPCLVSEIYPNENNGRIILCGTHPEYMIWWDGYIEEMNDDDFHCIATGFHQWKDITLRSIDGLDELTHTWWVVRRLVAWSAKIPDGHLPPIGDNQDSEVQVKSLLQELFWDGTPEKRMKYI